MSKSTTPSKTTPSPVHRHDSLREKAAKRRRDQNMILIGAAAVFVLLIGFVIWQNVRSQQPVSGETSLTSQGNIHIEFPATSMLEYNSMPPSSGPHYGNLAAWQVFTAPQRYEFLVHNLEDGGVVIYYQCPAGCPELVTQLEELTKPYMQAGKHVLVAPNDPTWTDGGNKPLHKDMGAKIAITAWTKILKMDEFDGPRLKEFIDRYEGKDHHNGVNG